MSPDALLGDPYMIPAARGRPEQQPSRDICGHVSPENQTRPHDGRCNQDSHNAAVLFGHRSVVANAANAA